MTIQEVIDILEKDVDLTGRTIYVKLPVEHIVHVTETWASILGTRPTILIRDIRGTVHYMASEFVITITPPTIPSQRDWIYMLFRLEGAEADVR